MTPLHRCETHGVTWLEGFEPCPKCAELNRKSNELTTRISVKRTKSGKTWPLGKQEQTS